MIGSSFRGDWMNKSSIIHQILAISDGDNGGDNALDGFEFQVSSAIYLIFKELRDDKDFALIYEKVEDFVIISDRVNLYQAKSISNNLTPKLLYKPSRITKNDNSGLSIIEKMFINYNSVVNELGITEVDSHLVICENNIFSKQLSKNHEGIHELRTLCFSDLSDETKQEIINATTFESYDWDNIYATRLIPKPRHEEVTRVFIEDTINEILGENKINSTALYNALTYEIRRIRKNKLELTKSFLSEQIHKYTSFDNDISFSDWAHLLNDKDRRNIQINLAFNEMKHIILINNHPVSLDYQKIKDYFNIDNVEDLYDIYAEIKNNNLFEDICIRLNDNEIKALILLIVAKEMN